VVVGGRSSRRSSAASSSSDYLLSLWEGTNARSDYIVGTFV
jgi:hypothetical protein